MDSLNSPSREPFEKIVADVLAGVPEGSTPTFSLLPEIWAAPQSIPPEKVDLLVPLLRQVKLYPRTGEFRFSTSGEYLHISDGGSQPSSSGFSKPRFPVHLSRLTVGLRRKH